MKTEYYQGLEITIHENGTCETRAIYPMHVKLLAQFAAERKMKAYRGVSGNGSYYGWINNQAVLLQDADWVYLVPPEELEEKPLETPSENPLDIVEDENKTPMFVDEVQDKPIVEEADNEKITVESVKIQVADTEEIDYKAKYEALSAEHSALLVEYNKVVEAIALLSSLSPKE